MLFLQDLDGVKALMKEHAEILSPKFKTVEKHLNEGLQGRGMGSWSSCSNFPCLFPEVLR